MKPEIEKLPQVKQFEGLYFDPQSMLVTLNYRPVQKPNTVCQLSFEFQSSSVLAGWLVQMYEQLTNDTSLGERVRATKLKGDKPMGSA